MRLRSGKEVQKIPTPYKDNSGETLYDGDVVQSGIRKHVIFAGMNPDMKVIVLGKKIGNIYDTPDILDRVFL